MIYNLKKKEIERVILSSLLKSFGTIIILQIINFLVHLFKSLPIDSVRFSEGLFYINGETVSFSLLSSLKMFFILVVLLVVYGLYKAKKENNRKGNV
jgi:lipoprotein signal peptidase